MSAAYHGWVEKSLQDGRAGYRPGRYSPTCGNASALRAFLFVGVRKARAASLEGEKELYFAKVQKYISFFLSLELGLSGISRVTSQSMGGKGGFEVPPVPFLFQI